MVTDKRKHVVMGRPLKNPAQKVGWPLRFLVTPLIESTCYKLANEMDLPISDFLRLGLYRFLDNQQVLTKEIREDPTWNKLRDKGFV